MKLRRHPLSLTHDSFLDVVFNVVGVLVLVVIAVILHTTDVKIALGAPVLRDPPPNASRMTFECSRGRVFRLDDEELYRLWDERARRELDRTGKRSLSPSEMERLFEQDDVGDRFYRVRAPMGHGTKVQEFALRAEATGDGLADLEDPACDFRRELARLDPERRWVWFVVRSDSFEIFRTARRLAREQGLAVGWGPMEVGAPALFGADGRGGVQTQW